jgi:hypothetical protein
MVCWPKLIASQEASPTVAQEQCDHHFDEAAAATRIEFVATPGLWDRLMNGGVIPSAEELTLYGAKKAEALTCAATSVIWRSLLRPHHIPSARSVPVALRILEHSDTLNPSALFGLAHWTRGTLRAQAPVTYGGKLPMAQMDFENARKYGGEMSAFAAGLEARFLCTALQDEGCFTEAATRAEKNTMDGLTAAIDGLISWVKKRRNLLFLDSPMSNN